MPLTSEGPADGMVLTTFRLPHVAAAREVCVVGEFNDWSRTAHPMTCRDGEFSIQIPLRPGRAYRFRYLLDGERWENDWAADDYVTNEFGGEDSLIDLTRVEPARRPPAVPVDQGTRRRARSPQPETEDLAAPGA